MLRITGSVGRGGANNFNDVQDVQMLLNEGHHLHTALPALSVDGQCGPRTIGRIEVFQRDVFKLSIVDGRIDPHGPTIGSLIRSRRPGSRPAARAPASSGSTRAAPAPAPAPQRISQSLDIVNVSGLNFPLRILPQLPYDGPGSGGRRFNAPRGTQRLHAGCDLVAPVGTGVYAMDDGEVLHIHPNFYLGSDAMWVRHGSFIANYAEIKPLYRRGSEVRRGQLIARVSVLNGSTASMLHFEAYSGRVQGENNFLGSNRPYRRRGDLADPTLLLNNAIRGW
jgi:murein DD-endopeptidase MepM/ murein hydrolase activator NlpD